MVFNGLNKIFLFNIKDFDEVKTEFKRLKQTFLKAWIELTTQKIKTNPQNDHLLASCDIYSF
jgi:hypothetical protein